MSGQNNKMPLNSEIERSRQNVTVVLKLPGTVLVP